MDGTYPARTTTNTDHAECRGKPSHDSWLELRFIVPIEPSSVPESGKSLKEVIKRMVAYVVYAQTKNR